MNIRHFGFVLAFFATSFCNAQEERRLTVDNLFQLVESNSKTLRQQKTSVEFAKKGVEAAHTEWLPELSVSASASLLGDVYVTNRNLSHGQGFTSPRFGNSLSIEAQQVIYAGGAVNASVNLAELAAGQADVSEQLTRQHERFLALSLYLELYKLDNRHEVYVKNIALTEKLIDEIRAKHEQGMALLNDVTRYELQLEDLRLGLRCVDDRRAVLNYQLGNQTGLAGVIIRPDSSVVTTIYAHDTESNWQSLAMLSSPRLQQSVVAQQMASEQVNLAKSELRPHISLFAADNFNGPFTYDLPPVDKNINVWYVGIGLKYPVSALFKSRRRVEQREVAVRQLAENHEALSQELNNQMQEAHTIYEQAYVELETRKKSLELAQQNYKVVNHRYLSQLALVTDMIDASNLLLNAELQVVDARINIAFAYYKMKYVAGVI